MWSLQQFWSIDVAVFVTVDINCIGSLNSTENDSSCHPSWQALWKTHLHTTATQTWGKMTNVIALPVEKHSGVHKQESTSNPGSFSKTKHVVPESPCLCLPTSTINMILCSQSAHCTKQIHSWLCSQFHCQRLLFEHTLHPCALHMTQMSFLKERHQWCHSVSSLHFL